ncbi:MAG: complex I NDUFA9 subunit family protein [Gammaproteobacteria bacterium]|nr:complex I NDUFA9 subunit family protein [Gammaproteobacteria bacterium]MCP5196687.1 complex I NDUFA9 subunit family protein [Gammaproteobacteria bacterium]
MKVQKICVFGGTGFVGRHLVARLANRGHTVRVPTRHPQRHREIEILPGAELVGANIHDPQTLRELLTGCDTAINLAGVLHEHSNQSFRTVHVELPGKIMDACRATGAKRLLHMSALHADAAKGPSQYLFTKGEGEQMILQAKELAVTVFKPSIIFGPDDNFYNQFANLLKLTLVLPLACPNSRFAPVYIGDVAGAFEAALENDATIGQSYELCGPRIYAFKELVEDIARMLGKKRLVVGLPDSLAQLQAKIFGMLPVKIFTTDNYLSLQVDSVCSCNGLEALGITPHSVEGIMPAHFADDPYDTLRQAARRS